MALARFDPRTKLMLMICVSTLAIVWRNPAWLACLLAFTCALLVGGGVGPSSVMSQAKSVLRIIAVLFVVQCVFVRGGAPLLTVGHLTLVTVNGLDVALAVTLRLLIFVCSALILLTGDTRDYLLALVQCKVPFEIAFMTMMALHFLPLLREEALDVYHAVQMRGAELRKASLIEKLRVYVRIAVPILAGAIKRAERTSIAMEARGFRAHPRRTSMRRLQLAPRDVVCLFALPLLSTAALVASIRWP
jgi:energy-coupling factor transport system permease protein